MAITRPVNSKGVEVLYMPEETTVPDTQPTELSVLFNQIWSSIAHQHNSGSTTAPAYLSHGGVWSRPQDNGLQSNVRVSVNGVLQDKEVFWTDGIGVSAPFGYIKETINADVSLNNYTTEGLFRFVSGVLNRPTTISTGVLLVLRGRTENSIPTPVTQVIFGDNANFALRSRTSAGVWSNWTVPTGTGGISTELETLVNDAISRGQIGDTYWPVSGGLTIYVRTDGNNNNNGLSNSATGAVLNWTGVFEVLRRINVRDAPVTVQFGSGTFTGEDLIGDQFSGAGTKYLNIYGVAGETFFSSTFTVRNLRVTVKDIEFQSVVNIYENAMVYFSGGCVFNNSLVARYGGRVALTSGVFKGAGTHDAIAVYQGGHISLTTNITFSGAFGTAMSAESGGVIDIRDPANFPINFTTASFSVSFLYLGNRAGSGEILFYSVPKITGTATGVRYYLRDTGSIGGLTKTQLDNLAIGNLPGVITAGYGVSRSGEFISGGTSFAAGYLLADGTEAFSPFLTSDTTLYVRTNGNDSNNGLTEATAMATLNGAKTLLNKIDPRGYSVIIDIGPGEFERADFHNLINYDVHNLFIRGAGVSKTFIIGTSQMHIRCCISDVCLRVDLNSRDGTSAIYRYDGAQATIKLIGVGLRADFNNSEWALGGAIVQFSGTIANGLSADFGGTFRCTGATQFVAVDNPTFTSQFAYAARGALISFYDCTFSGTATGRKYNVYQGGVIAGHGNNADLTALLGSTAGVVTSTGGFIGANGVARGVAVVYAAGTFASSTPAIVSVTKTATGTYQIATNITASLIPMVSAVGSGDVRGAVSYSGNTVTVYMRNAAGTLFDCAFVIAIF